MKIRVTIEYDPDEEALTDDERNAILIKQRCDWMEGQVNVYDVEQTGGLVKFEIIP